MSANVDIFERNVADQTEALRDATVGIAGCGGLGSNIAVSLVRAGIGRLILVDFDRVEPSNLNRQHFFLSDIGQLKVEALSRHLTAINPDVRIQSHPERLDADRTPVVFREADLLLEAFDRAESKKWLIEAWCVAYPDRPIICGNGLSGAGDTESLHVLKMGPITLCGDGRTDMTIGLSAPRVAIVAAMQANEAVAYFLRRHLARRTATEREREIR